MRRPWAAVCLHAAVSEYSLSTRLAAEAVERGLVTVSDWMGRAASVRDERRGEGSGNAERVYDVGHHLWCDLPVSPVLPFGAIYLLTYLLQFAIPYC